MIPLDADAVRAASPAGAVIGRTVQVFAEVDSTNDVVARAGRSGAAEGLVVFAESQRAGRGRRGRRWSSAPGLGLWFSVLLRPSRAPGPLALLAAVAVAGAVEEAVGRPAGVKWPNDVLLDGRKVAGVLIEATGGFVVVGIGVNANQGREDFPPELRGRAGSLAMASGGQAVDRATLAGRLLGELDACYRSWPANMASIVAGCEARNTLRGRQVRTADGVVGTVTHIAADGGLRLRTAEDDGGRTIYAGEVLPL